MIELSLAQRVPAFRKWCGILFLLSVCSVIPMPGQPNDLIIRQFPDLAGLPSSNFTAACKDSLGYIWLGTSSGLARFDGQSFRLFRHIPGDNRSLLSNQVGSLGVMPNGLVMVKTAYGTCHFDPKTESFTTHSLPPGVERKQVIGGFLFESHMDRSLCHTLSLGDGRTFFKRLRTGRWHEISHFLIETNERKICCIFEDTLPIIWVSVGRTIFKWNEDTGERQAFKIPDSFTGEVIDFLKKPDGSFWLGMWGNGLLHFNPDRNEWSFVGRSRNLPKEITASLVWFNNPISRQKEVWMTTLAGPACMDPVQLTIRTYPPDNRGHRWSSHYPDSHPEFILPDEQMRKLWFIGQGVLDVCDFDEQTMGITPSHSGVNSCDLNSISHIVPNWDDPSKLLLLKYYGQKAAEYDMEQGRIREISHFLPDGASPASILWLHDGVLWAASTAGALYEKRAGSVRWNNISEKTDPQARLFSATLGGFKQMLQDNKKQIWCWSGRKGLFLINRLKSISKQVFENPNIHVNAMLTGGNGHPVYVVTALATLFRFSENGSLEQEIKLGDLLDKNTGLSALHIYSAICDRKGHLWMGTNKGVACFDPLQHKLTVFDESHGIPQTLVINVLPDSKGRIWVDCMEQLAVLYPETGQVRVFDSNDGYLGDVNGMALFELPDSTILAAGGDAVYHFNLTQPPGNSTLWPIRLNRLVAGADTLIPYYENGQLKKIELFAADNRLELDFALLNFANPNHNSYWYQIEGIHRDWLPLGNAGKLHYAGLPSGRYKLKIKAFSIHKPDVVSEIALDLNVHPLFWQTPWFILLSIAVILAGFYGLYRYRLTQVLRVEKTRTRIARDLHDDIGSALSSISMWSNMTMATIQNNPEKARESAEKVGETARQVMETMDDIIWIANPQYDSLSGMMAKMKTLAVSVAEANGIEPEFDFQEYSDNLQLHMELRRNLFLIFKEAVNNMAKYAQCTRAYFVFKKSEGRLLMEIRDNGIGFDLKNIATMQGSGLRNIRQRAEESGGQLAIISTINEGTTIRLIL
ncbi:MAG: two-component regulator propeller domain-containing protein [Saprospiraceae bacterium]